MDFENLIEHKQYKPTLLKPYKVLFCSEQLFRYVSARQIKIHVPQSLHTKIIENVCWMEYVMFNSELVNDKGGREVERRIWFFYI